LKNMIVSRPESDSIGRAFSQLHELNYSEHQSA
jgi:hypothetical protein